MVLYNALTLGVAATHLWFLALEMFLWTRPLGRKTFRTSEAFARESKSLAANQGLYNGFLAAGLIVGMSFGTEGELLRVFSLGCVVVAGIYGAFTVSSRIFWLQALPAIVALAVRVTL